MEDGEEVLLVAVVVLRRRVHYAHIIKERGDVEVRLEDAQTEPPEAAGLGPVPLHEGPHPEVEQAAGLGLRGLRGSRAPGAAGGRRGAPGDVLPLVGACFHESLDVAVTIELVEEVLVHRVAPRGPGPLQRLDGLRLAERVDLLRLHPEEHEVEEGEVLAVGQLQLEELGQRAQLEAVPRDLRARVLVQRVPEEQRRGEEGAQGLEAREQALEAPTEHLQVRVAVLCMLGECCLEDHALQPRVYCRDLEHAVKEPVEVREGEGLEGVLPVCFHEGHHCLVALVLQVRLRHLPEVLEHPSGDARVVAPMERRDDPVHREVGPDLVRQLRVLRDGFLLHDDVDDPPVRRVDNQRAGAPARSADATAADVDGRGPDLEELAELVVGELLHRALAAENGGSAPLSVAQPGTALVGVRLLVERHLRGIRDAHGVLVGGQALAAPGDAAPAPLREERDHAAQVRVRARGDLVVFRLQRGTPMQIH
mmetsp:Transcript_102865/g.291304  ORF Transcript_102865/g.291304 Transcript_102865/m.291304 type:complete len:479 (-) Transcript_102865:219-1655(-)